VLQRLAPRPRSPQERSCDHRDRLLVADAVTAAKSGQKTPDGYYNVERMLKGVVAGKGHILLCGTCMDAHVVDSEIVTGARRSTMAELAAMTISAEKVLVF
jgi:uncharacterized protein involved in oxidation of intracellular sulfur